MAASTARANERTRRRCKALRVPASPSRIHSFPRLGAAMSPRLSLLLLLSACAGPAAHQAITRGSALDPNQEEAKRAPVADVLASPDPLGGSAKEEEPEQKP